MFIHHTPRCGLVFLAAAVACLIHLQSYAGGACPEGRVDTFQGSVGIQLNHDGSQIAIHGRKQAILGDASTGRIIRSFDRVAGFPEPQIIQLLFSTNGGKVAGAYDDGGLLIWNTADGSEVGRVDDDYKAKILCGSDAGERFLLRHIGPLGSFAFTSTASPSAFMGFVDDETLVKTPHSLGLEGLQDISADGSRLLKFPSVFDSETGTVAATLDTGTKAKNLLDPVNPRFSMDGSKVIRADGDISVWDAASGALIDSAPSPVGTVRSWESDGNVIIIAGRDLDEPVHVLDAETLDIEYTLPAFHLVPGEISIAADGSRFAISYGAGVSVHDLATGELVSEFIGSIFTVYSDDLQTVASIAAPWVLHPDDSPSPQISATHAMLLVQRAGAGDVRIPVNGGVNPNGNIALTHDGNTVVYYNFTDEEFRFHHALDGDVLFSVPYDRDEWSDSFGIFEFSFSPDDRYFEFVNGGDAYRIDMEAPENGPVPAPGNKALPPVQERDLYDLTTELIDTTQDGSLQLVRNWGYIEIDYDCSNFDSTIAEYGHHEVIETETESVVKVLEGIYNPIRFSLDGQYLVLEGRFGAVIPIYECDPEANAAAATAAILALPGLDFNQDGKLDESEYAGMQSGSPEDFVALDLNGDGALSLAELLRHIPADRPIHNADTNGDGKLSIGELLRLVQFYNAGGYDCAADPDDTEDGYLPDGDAKLSSGCPAHAADYLNSDGVIDLTELLRLIQLYNLGGIAPCETSEDGFCAVES